MSFSSSKKKSGTENGLKTEAFNRQFERKRWKTRTEMFNEFEFWLEDDQNLNIWESLDHQVCWGSIGKDFSREDVSPAIDFERPGCLLTSDGSEDHKVKIEGIPNYTTMYVRYNDNDDDDDQMHLEEIQKQQTCQARIPNMRMKNKLMLKSCIQKVITIILAVL